jgi:hypothetical protein
MVNPYNPDALLVLDNFRNIENIGVLSSCGPNALYVVLDQF